MAFRPRDHVQPWPFGHAIAFNNLQPTYLGLWPRVRVQPSTLAFGHATRTNFNQPTFNQPTFNQPSTNLPWPLATRSRSTFNQPTLAFRPRVRVQPIGRVIINSVP
ncbi:hypothetical protein [Moorena sp. SIO4G3]|uniref:hypothetical protein n=1 Tax=Moorena sp. SIO4G3 TaxID=2607821 RepID=UPI00142B8DB0|nr:hypothetical protein [Moorena sp. SIO4G3]NEO78856.1 hypothetical protein [Moorena sp. SIO4G3]